MRKMPWLFWSALLLVVLLSSGQWWGVLWKTLSDDGFTPTPANVRYLIMPTCPADVSELELGAICKEPSSGKIRYRGTLEAVP